MSEEKKSVLALAIGGPFNGQQIEIGPDASSLILLTKTENQDDVGLVLKVDSGDLESHAKSTYLYRRTKVSGFMNEIHVIVHMGPDVSFVLGKIDDVIRHTIAVMAGAVLVGRDSKTIFDLRERLENGEPIPGGAADFFGVADQIVTEESESKPESIMPYEEAKLTPIETLTGEIYSQLKEANGNLDAGMPFSLSESIESVLELCARLAKVLDGEDPVAPGAHVLLPLPDGGTQSVKWDELKAIPKLSELDGRPSVQLRLLNDILLPEVPRERAGTRRHAALTGEDVHRDQGSPRRGRESSDHRVHPSDRREVVPHGRGWLVRRVHVRDLQATGAFGPAL